MSIDSKLRPKLIHQSVFIGVITSIVLSVIIQIFISRFDQYAKVPPVLAFSIDYNGCLANERYQGQYIEWIKWTHAHQDSSIRSIPWKEALLSYHNAKLSGFLTQTVYQAIGSAQLSKTSILLLNGSNRQFPTRSANTPGTVEYFNDSPLPVALDASEVFFRYMTSLFSMSKISLKIEPLLLADIYDNHTDGYTWEKTKRIGITNQGVSTSAMKNRMDRDKFDVIYSQVHKVATQFRKTDFLAKQRTIQFYYFDDTLEILERLSKFFNDNPDLLPANVKLFFMHYTGDVLSQLASIQGQGLIDVHYPSSVCYTYGAFKDEIKNNKLHKIQLLSKQENLKAFKNYRSSAKNGLIINSLPTTVGSEV